MSAKIKTTCLAHPIAALMALGLASLPASAATPAGSLVIAWNIDAISTFVPCTDRRGRHR